MASADRAGLADMTPAQRARAGLGIALMETYFKREPSRSTERAGAAASAASAADVDVATSTSATAAAPVLRTPHSEAIDTRERPRSGAMVVRKRPLDRERSETSVPLAEREQKYR